jgi:hypothetical protein
VRLCHERRQPGDAAAGRGHAGERVDGVADQPRCHLRIEAASVADEAPAQVAAVHRPAQRQAGVVLHLLRRGRGAGTRQVLRRGAEHARHRGDTARDQAVVQLRFDADTDVHTLLRMIDAVIGAEQLDRQAPMPRRQRRQQHMPSERGGAGHAQAPFRLGLRVGAECRARSRSSSTCRTCCRYNAPRSVSARLRVVRMSRRTPSCAASRAMFWLTGDADRVLLHPGGAAAGDAIGGRDGASAALRVRVALRVMRLWWR